LARASIAVVAVVMGAPFSHAALNCYLLQGREKRSRSEWRSFLIFS
jgi:hypothetical protein